MKLKYFFLALALAAVEVSADNSTLDAAIGGALGGAAGAALGNEIGGRNGAIIGGAVGAGVGSAITTDDDHRHASRKNPYYSAPPGGQYYNAPPSGVRHQYNHYDYDRGYHCPPGQAKKGRC
ncbi:glycine zipper domain-containing protein [Nitrosomonas sp. Nm34]|uniref:glycine zipper domain-containing protein n=1 Tax=Nitrosomonas sp. Nm34 TaxID=1881055 RepID=UPI0008E6130D|nr:glycine zipper domain-containing protein [Nitrosomonas sp. Nm34]SFI64171.1 hypothetical protein SAMN05428978_102224 [Nitrosomonas sp. Nm34]